MSKKRINNGHVRTTTITQQAMLVRAMMNGRRVLYDGVEMFVIGQDGDTFTLSTRRRSQRKKRTRRTRKPDKSGNRTPIATTTHGADT